MKGMNPTFLLAMSKIVRQTRFSSLVWQPVYEKANSEFKRVKEETGSDKTTPLSFTRTIMVVNIK